MTDIISESLGSPRFQTVLIATFAVVALALAIIGVFGVISYSVGQRNHELAIRLALGAQPSEVFTLVAGAGIRLVLAGVAMGIVLALLLTNSLSSLLFGIVPTDPLTYAAVALLLSTVAVTASCLPCRRATRVDPAVALRWE